MKRRFLAAVIVLLVCGGCVAYYQDPYYYPYSYRPYYYPSYRPSAAYYYPGWTYWYPSLYLGYGYRGYHGHHGYQGHHGYRSPYYHHGGGRR